MDRESLLGAVAPCSLLCYTCPALGGGAIAQCAGKLCAYFDGYYDFNDANLSSAHRAWLAQFESFYNRLERYAHPRCGGCRSKKIAGSGCIEGCVVPDCAREHQVDFCADCAQFPCAKAEAFFTGINGVIGSDWKKGTSRIREIGIERFFEERKDLSHYQSYKKQAQIQEDAPCEIDGGYNHVGTQDGDGGGSGDRGGHAG